MARDKNNQLLSFVEQLMTFGTLTCTGTLTHTPLTVKRAAEKSDRSAYGHSISPACMCLCERHVLVNSAH